MSTTDKLNLNPVVVLRHLDGANSSSKKKDIIKIPTPNKRHTIRQIIRKYMDDYKKQIMNKSLFRRQAPHCPIRFKFNLQSIENRSDSDHRALANKSKIVSENLNKRLETLKKKFTLINKRNRNKYRIKSDGTRDDSVANFVFEVLHDNVVKDEEITDHVGCGVRKELKRKQNTDYVESKAKKKFNKRRDTDYVECEVEKEFKRKQKTDTSIVVPAFKSIDCSGDSNTSEIKDQLTPPDAVRNKKVDSNDCLNITNVKECSVSLSKNQSMTSEAVRNKKVDSNDCSNIANVKECSVCMSENQSMPLDADRNKKVDSNAYSNIANVKECRVSLSGNQSTLSDIVRNKKDNTNDCLNITDVKECSVSLNNSQSMPSDAVGNKKVDSNDCSNVANVKKCRVSLSENQSTLSDVVRNKKDDTNDCLNIADIKECSVSLTNSQSMPSDAVGNKKVDSNDCSNIANVKKCRVSLSENQSMLSDVVRNKKDDTNDCLNIANVKECSVSLTNSQSMPSDAVGNEKVDSNDCSNIANVKKSRVSLSENQSTPSDAVSNKKVDSNVCLNIANVKACRVSLSKSEMIENLVSSDKKWTHKEDVIVDIPNSFFTRIAKDDSTVRASELKSSEETIDVEPEMEPCTSQRLSKKTADKELKHCSENVYKVVMLKNNSLLLRLEPKDKADPAHGTKCRRKERRKKRKRKDREMAYSQDKEEFTRIEEDIVTIIDELYDDFGESLEVVPSISSEDFDNRCTYINIKADDRLVDSTGKNTAQECVVSGEDSGDSDNCNTSLNVNNLESVDLKPLSVSLTPIVVPEEVKEHSRTVSEPILPSAITAEATKQLNNTPAVTRIKNKAGDHGNFKRITRKNSDGGKFQNSNLNNNFIFEKRTADCVVLTTSAVVHVDCTNDDPRKSIGAKAPPRVVHAPISCLYADDEKNTGNVYYFSDADSEIKPFPENENVTDENRQKKRIVTSSTVCKYCRKSFPNKKVLRKHYPTSCKSACGNES